MGKRINRRGADARVAEDPAEGFYVFGMAVPCKDLLKKYDKDILAGICHKSVLKL
jgi:hypothetical protein